jgi:ABC-2 type transport system permease protein
MIFLSGLFIPVSSLPFFIKPVAYLMPLTYSIDSLKVSFGYEPQIMNPLFSLLVLAGYGIVFFGLSVKILKRRMS